MVVLCCLFFGELMAKVLKEATAIHGARSNRALTETMTMVMAVALVVVEKGQRNFENAVVVKGWKLPSLFQLLNFLTSSEYLRGKSLFFQTA